MKIGFAVRDITPETGIYLTGYGRPERLATGVHSPLTATAMVLQEDSREAVIIGLDWCFVDWELTREIRKGIMDAAGIPEQNILLCCSHTHSAPHTTYMRTLGRADVDPDNEGVEYVKKSIPAIADAVRCAKASMRDAEAGFAAGKTKTGISRRGMSEDGKVGTGFIGDPDMICDNNMTAVRFIDRKTRQSIGILIHCSAHNTAMGADRSISSDWCGVMKKRISQRYNVPVLFINGALGDVGPRTNSWISDNLTFFGFSAGAGDGPASAEEVGYRAAYDALQLLEGMRDFRAELSLKIHTGIISLPQSIPLSLPEAENIIRQYDRQTGEETELPLDYQLAKIAVESWMKPPQPTFDFEQTLVIFGPVALVPFPFEMFSVFSLRLRKYGPFEYTLLCSNTNGRNGYLPDRGAIACGGYEIDWRKVVSPYVLDPEAGDLAVLQSLKSLREVK